MNPVIDCLMNRKSIRKYKDGVPPDDLLEAVVRAGQQAPFAYQVYSVLLTREREKIQFRAPWLFTICIDLHKFELIMAKRGWQTVQNDLSLLLLGLQDAAYMAENMVTAGESLGLGSCYLGAAPYLALKIREEYSLPDRVFPLVQLVMGYPDENPPVRPRYPLNFVLFEGKYPDITDAQLEEAMKTMDQGYLSQDYYQKINYMIPVGKGMQEKYTFDNYSWSEHISRKLGLWQSDLGEMLDKLEKCGFKVSR
ncbi:MAG: nitroreductase family protein [Candidatus Wallbacteria bacterium]|nr:nitroreductase family protein [Candidatus Wallbacteria bacterium]